MNYLEIRNTVSSIWETMVDITKNFLYPMRAPATAEIRKRLENLQIDCPIYSRPHLPKEGNEPALFLFFEVLEVSAGSITFIVAAAASETRESEAQRIADLVFKGLHDQSFIIGDGEPAIGGTSGTIQRDETFDPEVIDGFNYSASLYTIMRASIPIREGVPLRRRGPLRAAYAANGDAMDSSDAVAKAYEAHYCTNKIENPCKCNNGFNQVDMFYAGQILKNGQWVQARGAKCQRCGTTYLICGWCGEVLFSWPQSKPR